MLMALQVTTLLVPHTPRYKCEIIAGLKVRCLGLGAGHDAAGSASDLGDVRGRVLLKCELGDDCIWVGGGKEGQFRGGGIPASTISLQVGMQVWRKRWIYTNGDSSCRSMWHQFISEC